MLLLSPASHGPREWTSHHARRYRLRGLTPRDVACFANNTREGHHSSPTHRPINCGSNTRQRHASPLPPPRRAFAPGPVPKYLYIADKGPKLTKSCFVRWTRRLVQLLLRGRISKQVPLVVVLRGRRFRAGREAIPVHLVSVCLRGFARRRGLVGIVPLVQLVVANRRDRVVLAAAGVCFPLRPRS